MTNRWPLEAVLCTEQLKFRAYRAPDFEMETRMLGQMIKALSDFHGTILQQLAEIMLKIFDVGSAGFSIYAREHGNERFRWVAIAGKWSPLLGGDTSRELSPSGNVLDCNTPLLFRKLQLHYPAFRGLSPPAEECLLVPFCVQGKVLGAIWLVFHDEKRQFDSENVRQLVSASHFATAAYQLVIASEKMRGVNEALLLGSISQDELAETADQLNEQLREELIRRKKSEDHLTNEANRDKLTNLFNRRAYDDVMVEAYHRLQRNGETMALIAVDVDHFKKVNDTYGHHTGDEVLKAIATVLVSTVRTIDKVFRIGGEEFSILLPGADQLAAAGAAERLRRAVETQDIVTEQGNIRITISLGLAVGLNLSHTPEILNKNADIALYQAKAWGRNIVINAELGP
jgi:diguanylate cyclase (GGDEF)-like protein